MTFKRLFRNVISSWAGYIATLLVSFFLAPVVVHRLGASGYGVWTLVVSLTGYCGLLDLGLRSALMRFVSRDVAQNDPAKVNKTLSSAMAMLGSAGVLAFLVTLGIYSAFDIFSVESALGPAARTALLISGLNISLILPLSVFSVMPPSLERYDVINTITVGAALLRAALVMTVLQLGWGIVGLSLVSLIVSMSEYGASAVAARRLYPSLRLSWRSVDIATCRDLFGFGVFRFVWIVANQLIYYTDSVVIGLFLNAGAITTYAIAGSLINYGRNIVSLATDTLFPATNRLDSENDRVGLRGLYILGTKLGLFIGLVLCTGFVFFGETFIRLWMGEEYIGSAAILLVLTIPQFSSMSQYMSALVLVATGRHKFLAFLALAEATANLSLSIVLVRYMGLIGVAWATALPHIVTTALILPYVTSRALKMNPKDLLAKAYAGPVMCAIPVAVISYHLEQYGQTLTWTTLAAKLSMHCGMFGILGYLICLNRAQRVLVRQTLLRAMWRVA